MLLPKFRRRARLSLISLEQRAVPATLDTDWVLHLDPAPHGTQPLQVVQRYLDDVGPGSVAVRDLGHQGYFLIRTPNATAIEELTPKIGAMPGFVDVKPNRFGDMTMFNTKATTPVAYLPEAGNWLVRFRDLTGSRAAQEQQMQLLIDGIQAPLSIATLAGPDGLAFAWSEPEVTLQQLQLQLASIGSQFVSIEPNYLNSGSALVWSQAFVDDYLPESWLVNFAGISGYGPDQVPLAQARLDAANTGATALQWLGADGLIVVSPPSNITFEEFQIRMCQVEGFERMECNFQFQIDDPIPAPPEPLVDNPARWLATAADAGGSPHVILRTDVTGDNEADTIVASFMAFDPSFRGGVRIASGDFNGDGIDELVTAAGPGGGPHIKIWNVDNQGHVTGLRDQFFAFDLGFRGGCYVAAGDFDHDGKDELVVSAGETGGPHVKIFSDVNNDGRVSDAMTDQFFAFDARFRGGVRLAVGQFRQHVDMLVVAAGPSGGPHVKIYDNTGINGFDRRISDEPIIDQFYAFDANYTGGVEVAASPVQNYPRADLIVSAGSRVKVYDKGYYYLPPGPGIAPYQARLHQVYPNEFTATDNGSPILVRPGWTYFHHNFSYPQLILAHQAGGRGVVANWYQTHPSNVNSYQSAYDFFSFTDETGRPYGIGVFVAFGNGDRLRPI